MSELRIFIAAVFLIYIATFSHAAWATGDDDSRESRWEYRSSESHERDEDEDENEMHESRTSQKNVSEKNHEKLKNLRKKVTQIVRLKAPVKSQTGRVLAPIKKIVTKPVVSQKTTQVTPIIQSAAVTKSSTITYRTPEWSDPVLFTVTVKNGIITSASSVTRARDGTSIWYQDSFAKSVTSAVVWKKIANLNLSAIGGASLTTRAFTQFVQSSF